MKKYVEMSDYKLTEEELEEYGKMIDMWREIYVANAELINDYPVDGQYHPGMDQKSVFIHRILDNRKDVEGFPKPAWEGDYKDNPLGFRRLFNEEFKPFPGSGIEAFVDDSGSVALKKVFSGIGFLSPAGEKLGVCMRDGGFEINYGGSWYRLNGGIVEKLTDDKDGIEWTEAPDWNTVAGKLMMAILEKAGKLNYGPWFINSKQQEKFVYLLRAFSDEVPGISDYIKKSEKGINFLINPTSDSKKVYGSFESYKNLMHAIAEYKIEIDG